MGLHKERCLGWIGSICAGMLLTGAMIGFAQGPHASTRVWTSGMHPQMGSANIFSDTADAKAEIRSAILQAKDEHKNVILDFGGNWCPDCQLLNIYFHDPGNAALLARNYIKVDVNVGEYDKNLDLVRKYGIPLNKGVPALAVLDGSGREIYVQKNAEFEKMHQLDSTSVTAFLEKWKPGVKTAHPHPSHARATTHKPAGN